MSGTWPERLARSRDARDSILCVGVDPRADQLPEPLRTRAAAGPDEAALAFGEFGCTVVEAVADTACALKPNSAFWEVCGPAGLTALATVCDAAAARHLPVILDVKRGDIGSTSLAYARAWLDGPWACDAITIAPYLGADGLRPFLEVARDRGKGVFSLVRTSNKGAADLQDLEADGRPVWHHAAELLRRLGEDVFGDPEGGLSPAGAVVGATWPEQAREARELLPDAPFLVPGYGAQGGGASDALAGARPADAPGGAGCIVNSSRGIIFAHAREPWSERFPEERWADAVQAAAEAARDELNDALRDAGAAAAGTD